MEDLVRMIKKYGLIDLNKMLNDGLIHLKKEDNNVIPFRTFRENVDTLLIGQINSHNKLDGIGKKIHPWCILEGEFSDSQMCGFGRQIRGDKIYAFGYWKSDLLLKGYAKRLKEGKLSEGHWDEGNFYWGETTPKAKVKTYNPYVHINAQKVDYEKYEI